MYGRGYKWTPKKGKTRRRSEEPSINAEINIPILKDVIKAEEIELLHQDPMLERLK